jgi:hypothetical protein
MRRGIGALAAWNAGDTNGSGSLELCTIRSCIDLSFSRKAKEGRSSRDGALVARPLSIDNQLSIFGDGPVAIHDRKVGRLGRYQYRQRSKERPQGVTVE